MSRIYRHLSMAERNTIMQRRDARVPVGRIAHELGRHPSTIYREISRNFLYDEDPWYRGYYSRVAHRKAAARRLRGGKIERNSGLSLHIAERLAEGWSPEQISGHFRFGHDDLAKVCHETIYQFIHGPEGRRLGLWRYLPRQRKVRRRRYARKPRGLNIPLRNTIEQRPAIIADRVQFGHWEGDLIAFKKDFGKSNLTSLVERCSRYVLLARNPSRHSSGVMEGIEQHLRPLPQPLRRSITFDRGTEFAAFSTLECKLGMTAYFCRPSAPWQKGSVENSNGRLRRFLPLDTDINRISDADLTALTHRLNNIPRKCLGFRTPAAVFKEQIVACL